MKANQKNKQYGFLSESARIFPPMVFLEITNVCNLRCTHCPYTYIASRPGYMPKYMSWGIFKKVIDEISMYKTIVRFVCDGEPLLHPDLFRMMGYVKLYTQSPVCINTNGTLLNIKTSKFLLRYADVVEISIDAFLRETYEKIRIGSDFERVVSATLNLVRLRNRLNADTKIMVSFVDQKDNRKEKKKFFTYWSQQVDRVIIRPYTTIGNLVDTDKITFKKPRKRWPCPLLWTRLFINTDGFAKFCVEDWHDKTILYDVGKMKIRDIWNAPKYEGIRRIHIKREFRKIPYCRNCVDWPVRNWSYDYFYALKRLGVSR